MKLITGSGGFIGKAIVETYGDEALALSRQSHDTAKINNHISFDLSQSDQAAKLVDSLQNYEITEVIHAAAVTPWAGPANSDFSADLDMAQTITTICNDLRIPRLTFLSGWIVYDMQGSPPFDENTPLGPNTPYGESKLAVERYFDENLKHTVHVKARLASVYGPGQTSAGLIPNFVHLALQDKELVVNSKQTRRDYLYIDDLTTALHQLSMQDIPKSMAINIGSGEALTVLDVAQTIQQLCGELYQKDVTIDIASESPQEANPINNRLDITKAQSFGVLRAPTPLTNGLRAYIEWRNKEQVQ